MKKLTILISFAILLITMPAIAGPSQPVIFQQKGVEGLQFVPVPPKALLPLMNCGMGSIDCQIEACEELYTYVRAQIYDPNNSHRSNVLLAGGSSATCNSIPRGYWDATLYYMYADCTKNVTDFSEILKTASGNQCQNPIGKNSWNHGAFVLYVSAGDVAKLNTVIDPDIDSATDIGACINDFAVQPWIDECKNNCCVYKK